MYLQRFKAGMAVELSIIIVNWNGGELLQRCVESIIASPPQISYEIIVVDNASTDASIERLRSDDLAARLGGTQLHIIENRDNLGFGRANNQAITRSRAPLLFLLNPDTEVMPGAVDALVATISADKRIGACGPRLLNPDGSLQPSAWRNPPSAWYVLVNGLKLYRFLPRRVRGEWLLGQHWDHGHRRRVGALSGAAIMARRTMIDEIGAFDEQFDMYGEDAEWCLRIFRSGWEIIFEPTAQIIHHGGQSALKRWTDPERRLREIDAYMRFLKHCLSPKHVVANTLARSLILSLAWARRRMRGQSDADLNNMMRLNNAYLKQSFREMICGSHSPIEAPRK
jgi:GT2 family glycosyltransferase